MARRPVFIPEPQGGLVEERSVQFEWFPGFAISRKQQCIQSLHQSAFNRHGLKRVLEVSTKSPDHLGKRLSAFNLSVRLDAQPDPILLEAAFQGSKVFRNAKGPFPHLFSLRSGREVKRYMRRFADDQLTGFQCAGTQWPLTPKTAFYDWLYIRALRDLARSDGEIDRSLRHYQAFTDIEFNPAKSVNCQARSCALYVALLQQDDSHHLDHLGDRDEFLRMLNRQSYGVRSRATKPGPLQPSFLDD